MVYSCTLNDVCMLQPQVTKTLFHHCGPVVDIVVQKFPGPPKYKSVPNISIILMQVQNKNQVLIILIFKLDISLVYLEV